MGFLSDQLFDGTKIRVLTIVDTFSKVSPANKGLGPGVEVRMHGNAQNCFQGRFSLIKVTCVIADG